MKLIFFKPNANWKGFETMVLLLLFLFNFSAVAQNQNIEITNCLLQLVENQDLNPEDATEWKVTSQHISKTCNVEHIYFRQVYNGIENNGTNSSIHIMPNGRMLTNRHNFIKNINKKLAAPKTPKLSAINALEAVSQQLNYKETEAFYLIESKEGDNQSMILSSGGIFISPIPAKLMYQKNKTAKYVLAWDMSIEETSQKNWWSLRADTSTGEYLDKVNCILSCDFGTNHEHPNRGICNNGHELVYSSSNVLSSNMMAGGYNVFPMPVEMSNHGSRSMEIDTDHPIVSPYGWHETNLKMDDDPGLI